MNKDNNWQGLAAGLSAYFLWGILPFYWKWLSAFRPEVILGFRIAHAAVFLIALGLVRKRLFADLKLLKTPRLLWLSIANAVFITINWYVYIWAVNHAFIVEASLGYFINPLVSVAFGVIFLRERFTFTLGISVVFALVGVAIMTAGYGRVPWISLVLAFSFATYGLTKKLARLDGITGLTLETVLLFLPTVGYLLFRCSVRMDPVGAGTGAVVLSLLAGIITAIPLILLATPRSVSTLSTLGFMQYLAPTLQLIIGCWCIRKPSPAAISSRSALSGPAS
jgi:chloramphenicol-sensitive protein RarD